jgi:endonuclease YncB( thermonuclease family)
MRPLSLPAFVHSARGHGWIVAFAALGVGLVIGAAGRPTLRPQAAAPVATALAVPSYEPMQSTPPLSRRLDPALTYPADVLRVIDGDTFEARVRVWPGLDVDTKVRLRGIDAAELHARCSGELTQAQAARAALEAILGEGGVTISRVGIDKYGGRVDAAIATRNTADVSAAKISGGFARSYDGGKRGTWCG